MKISIFPKRLLSLWTLASLLALSLFSFTNAVGLPTGYSESYSIKTYSPNAMVSVYIDHSSSGDLLYISRPEYGGDSNCDNDGFTVQVTENSVTSVISPSFTYSGGICSNSSSKHNIGKSLYVDEYSAGASVVSGTINMGNYGGPSYKTTYWTQEAAGTAEVKLTSYYTTDTTAPTISGVYATPSDTGAVIKWDTNETSDSEVYYYTSGYTQSGTQTSSTQAVAHSVTLSNLSSGTTYYYRVKSKDSSGNLSQSSDYSFTTTGTSSSSSCSGLYLSTDKTSYAYGDTINLTYWCASPSTGLITNLLIQTIAPGSSDAQTIATYTNVNASSGTYGIPTGTMTQTNGTLMIRTCLGTTCTTNPWNTNSTTVSMTGGTTTSTTTTTTTTTTTDTTQTSTGTTTTTTDTTTYPNTFNTCSNYQENGLECSKCTDNEGKLTSQSCWTPWVSGTTYTVTKSCDYYTESGYLCMACYDEDDKMTNQSCWQEYEYDTTWGGGDEWYSTNDRYYDKAHCEYPYASNTNYSSTAWCEVCTVAGEEVRNTCENTDDDDDSLNNYCEYVDDESTGTWCNVCYGAGGQISSKSCSDDEENTIGDDELERQVNEMEKSLKYREHDLLEFARFEKRIDRKILEFERKIKSFNREVEWMTNDGIDTTGVEDVIEEINSLIDELEEMQSEVGDDYSDFEEEIENEADAIDSLASSDSVTWNHTDAAWLLLRRADIYQALRDIYEGKLSYMDMKMGYSEWQREESKLLAQLDSMGIEIDEDTLSDLGNADDMMAESEDNYDSYLDYASDLESVLKSVPSENSIDSLLEYETRDEFRSYFDYDLFDAWEDLRLARQTLNDSSYDMQYIWDYLQGLYELQNQQVNRNYLNDFIEEIKTDMEILESAFAILEGKTSESVQKKMDEILDVLPRVNEMITDIEENSDDAHSDYWQKFESLRKYLRPRLEGVIRYLDKNLYSGEFTNTEVDTLRELYDLEISNGGGGDGCYDCDDLDDIYGDMADKIKNLIRDEIVNDVINMLSSTLADALAEFIDDEVAGKVLQAIIASLDKLKGDKVGEEFGNDLLENSDTVLGGMQDVDLTVLDDAGFSDEADEFEYLQEDFQTIPMPDSELAARTVDYWEDVIEVASAEPTQEELDALLDEGESLYAECENSKYEYHLAFKDVPYVFDEEYDESTYWYSDYVIEGALDGRWEGYKDSDGELTYNFGPSDTTLRAEAMKMVLSGMGYEEEGSGNYWWSGWENTGDDLGMSIVNEDLTQPVTRMEVAQMIYEVGGMDAPDSLQGYFPDVSTADDWGIAEANYEAGIFEGDGDTGNFRPYDNLNRAESAAVINRAVEWQEGNEFVEEELYSYLPLYRRLLVRLGNAIDVIKVSVTSVF